jgi:hypothetical protein
MARVKNSIRIRRSHNQQKELKPEGDLEQTKEKGI